MRIHERIKEDAGRRLSEFTDADHSGRTYFWAIGIGSTGNLISWVVAFVTPEAIAEWVGSVTDISDKAKAYLLAVPFWSSFFAVYGLIRLRRYKNPTADIGDSDVFSRYRDTERSGYIRNCVLISLAAAAVNTIILVLLVIWMR